MKSLVFIIKSKDPMKEGIAVELEHKDTVEKIKKENLSPKAAAKEITLDHGKEVEPKNVKKGVKKYYKGLKKMEKKLKKSKEIKGKKKVSLVMQEWGKGNLHIGKSKKKVPAGKKDQKQAIAIALHQAGMSKSKKIKLSLTK